MKVGAVLYVPNAFGIVNHMLLLAKLKPYDIQPTALKQTAFILQAAMKGQKVNSAYSPWPEIIAGVSRGSNLLPLLFNIVLNNFLLYLEETFLSNYTDELPCTELAIQWIKLKKNTQKRLKLLKLKTVVMRKY